MKIVASMGSRTGKTCSQSLSSFRWPYTTFNNIVHLRLNICNLLFYRLSNYRKYNQQLKLDIARGI